MFTSRTGRRLLLLVAVCIALLIAGTGAAAACDTCADPDQEESDHEPFWSNDDFPYDTSENNSFVDIVVEETESEMEEDFGGGSDAAAASASAGDASVTVSANAEGATVAGGTTSAEAGVTLRSGAPFADE